MSLEIASKYFWKYFFTKHDRIHFRQMLLNIVSQMKYIMQKEQSVLKWLNNGMKGKRLQQAGNVSLKQQHKNEPKPSMFQYEPFCKCQGFVYFGILHEFAPCYFLLFANRSVSNASLNG